MPFPISVRENALVACQRHCCICHKYVGVKIECHHIVPEADGGENTEDNCIPLCFDCHAEVEHYNPRHPRGTRFRPSELQAHKARWLARLVDVTPAVYDTERREVDREIFKKIQTLVPEEYARDVLGMHCWGTPIKREDFRHIYEIADRLNLPSYEFLDSTCEGLRAEFVHALDKLLHDNSNFLQISPDHKLSEYYRLPKEWACNPDPEIRGQYDECLRQLNEASSEAYQKFRQLIREVRKLLIV